MPKCGRSGGEEIEKNSFERMLTEIRKYQGRHGEMGRFDYLGKCVLV